MISIINPYPVSSTYINKGSLTYMFTGTKILEGQLSHHVISIEGCLRLQKNLGSRPVNRRNFILYPFWWWGALGIFTNVLYGKTWENVQNRMLSWFQPPKWRFCAYFVPYPTRLNAIDILRHIWSIEIFVLWRG